jgi:hypothetical protein
MEGNSQGVCSSDHKNGMASDDIVDRGSGSSSNNKVLPTNKKALKQTYRREKKIRKLQVQWEHAHHRRDAVVADRAARELDALGVTPVRTAESVPLRLARAVIEEMNVHLQQRAWAGCGAAVVGAKVTTTTATPTDPASTAATPADPASTVRQAVGDDDEAKQQQQRYEQSHALLKNMTKGTAHIDLFHNLTALQGYTRRKFQSRAMLVAKSLDKLVLLQQKSNLGNSSGSNNSMVEPPVSSVNIHTIDAMVRQLQSVATICSIGSGPGCDAVGCWAYLQQLQRSAVAATESSSWSSTTASRGTSTPVNHIVLLDWAMEQWKPITGITRELLLADAEFAGCVTMASCNVRLPMDANDGPRGVLPLLNQNNNTGGINTTDDGGCSSTIYLLSYLLSETRGEWTSFVDDLIARSPSGTLFFISDPTAWQLHLFRKRYDSSSCSTGDDPSPPPPPTKGLDIVWLDSSMDHPELQSLETRFGPAVLLGMKR